MHSPGSWWVRCINDPPYGWSFRWFWWKKQCIEIFLFNLFEFIFWLPLDAYLLFFNIQKSFFRSLKKIMLGILRDTHLWYLFSCFLISHLHGKISWRDEQNTSSALSVQYRNNWQSPCWASAAMGWRWQCWVGHDQTYPMQPVSRGTALHACVLQTLLRSVAATLSLPLNVNSPKKESVDKLTRIPQVSYILYAKKGNRTAVLLYNTTILSGVSTVRKSKWYFHYIFHFKAELQCIKQCANSGQSLS